MNQAIKERRANLRRQCSETMTEIDRVLSGAAAPGRTVLDKDQLKAARREIAGMVEALDRGLESMLPLYFPRWVVDSCPYDDEVGGLLLSVADRYDRYRRKYEKYCRKREKMGE